MAQTSYASQPAPGIPGQLATSDYNFVTSRNNENASAISFGLFVKQGVAAKGGNLLAAATDVVIGVSVKSDAHAVDASFTGTQSIGASLDFDCIEEGGVWVAADADAPPVVGGPVYARFATGTKTVLGAARANNDSNTCKLVPGARVLGSGVSALGATMVLVWFSRSTQHASADVSDSTFSLAQVTGTTTTVLSHTAADRQYVVDSVEIDIPATGIVQDDSNYYVLQVLAGAVEVAAYSTKTTGGQGTITAAAWTQFINDVLANRCVPPGTALSFVQTLTGTKTAPACILALHGHYI